MNFLHTEQGIGLAIKNYYSPRGEACRMKKCVKFVFMKKAGNMDKKRILY